MNFGKSQLRVVPKIRIIRKVMKLYLQALGQFKSDLESFDCYDFGKTPCNGILLIFIEIGFFQGGIDEFPF
tara:strand:- start:744 stop:956 length:213 start_codon:yes stop_codon:yes gene_type:complete